LLGNLAFLAAFWLRFGLSIPAPSLEAYQSLVWWISGFVVLSLSLFDLYSPSWKKPLEILYSVGLAAGFVSVLTMAASFFQRKFAFPRSVLLLAIPAQTVFLGVWRLSAAYFWNHRGFSRILILGQEGEVAELAEKLREQRELEEWGRPEQKRTAALGRLSAPLRERVRAVQGLSPQVGEERVREAVAAAEAVFVAPSVPWRMKEAVLSWCFQGGKAVFLVPELYEILLHDARMDRISDLPVFALPPLGLSPGERLVKEAFDYLVAALGLVLTAPLWVLIALAIWLDSGWPIFYAQERVGEGGRVFRLLKFRTMVQGAERETGPVAASAFDPRVTRVGRLLRALRLDELPQLVNVLRGEMSLVGPRPERPEFVEEFERALPDYRYRTLVRPGLTGLAQVLGRYDTDAAAKLRYDLFYIRNYSFLLDLQILAQTMRVVFLPETARGWAKGQRRPNGEVARGAEAGQAGRAEANGVKGAEGKGSTSEGETTAVRGAEAARAEAAAAREEARAHGAQERAST
ncbi:MAG: sugar transferase, partial [Bacillota bacterium]|nr:sugar transferase [Bacillota bacterium]